MRDLQRLRDFQREWMRRRRSEWIAANGPCAQCGSSDRLEADHKDRTTKVFTASAVWGMALDNPNRVAELAKLQVLCHGCHKEKTRSEQTKPLVHGTDNAYRKKRCRCESCRAAKAAYIREWEARRARELGRLVRVDGRLVRQFAEPSSVRQTIGSMPSQDRPEVSA